MRRDPELLVGMFLVAGMLCVAYLCVRLGKVDVLQRRGTVIHAVFSSVGGLKEGAPIEIAGVEVGKVKRIRLTEDYQAEVEMYINPGIRIQEDAIASIKTKGLLGERYVEITPGSSEICLKSGDLLVDTQPPFSLEDAIARFIFSAGKRR